MNHLDQNTLARFWEKVERLSDEECWLWRGSLDGNGRATFRADGRLQKAGRIAYWISRGIELPRNALACHRCDNPRCVNPFHIFTGTAFDNMRDASQKGRLSNPSWIRANRTHCPKGHPFAGDNLYLTSEGWRKCRQCERDRRKATTEKKLGAPEKTPATHSIRKVA